MFEEIPAIEIPKEEEESKSEIVLREGIYPIMTCLGTEEDFDYQLYDIERFSINPGAKVIDFSETSENHTENGFTHDGYETYIISAIDSDDKGSDDYLDCTGIVAVGVDRETGENISFMSHQAPKKFLEKHRQKFLEDLRNHLKELKDRSEDQTIDIRIFGGNFLPPGRYRHDQGVKIIKSESYMNNYVDSIRILSETIRECLGFDPEVIGPKLQTGFDTAYFDTKSRRLYLVRPYIDEISSTVPPEWIEEMGRNWKDEHPKRLPKE